MQLVNRVSLFFLAALLAALVGCSLAIFFSLSFYLHSDFDSQLQAALQILCASVEIEPDDVTWNPAEYSLDFQHRTLRDAPWVIVNERGQIVDRSPLLSESRSENTAVLEFARTRRSPTPRTTELGDWRIVQRRLSAARPKPVELREPNEHASLVVTVAKPHTQLDTTLRRMTTLVCVLPALIWLVAAVSGRTYVRRSLMPLTAMVQRMRSIRRPDFTVRLPVDSSTGELNELATSFNQLLVQLQEAFEREQRFAGSAAHQLRTPLTVLQGHIDVARRRPRSPDEYRQTLDVLAESVEELRRIVDSLLFLARRDDALLPALGPVMLSQWLSEYIERWKLHPRAADLSLLLNGEPCVMASTPLLAQLLDALVSNAVKYSEAGTPIRIALSAGKATAEVAVGDRGIGVEEADRVAIFEPFFRSANARHAGIGGSGLGLAVARRIARFLLGDLVCQANPDAGATFLLVLPLCDERPRPGGEPARCAPQPVFLPSPPER